MEEKPELEEENRREHAKAKKQKKKSVYPKGGDPRIQTW